MLRHERAAMGGALGLSWTISDVTRRLVPCRCGQNEYSKRLRCGSGALVGCCRCCCFSDLQEYLLGRSAGDIGQKPKRQSESGPSRGSIQLVSHLLKENIQVRS